MGSLLGETPNQADPYPWFLIFIGQLGKRVVAFIVVPGRVLTERNAHRVPDRQNYSRTMAMASTSNNIPFPTRPAWTNVEAGGAD